MSMNESVTEFLRVLISTLLLQSLALDFGR